MKHFNFILTLITVGVLAAIGIMFIIGTVYSSIQDPSWTDTSLYQIYLDKMNMAVVPFVIALLVVLGLCIPKRLFSGLALLQFNLALLFATVFVAILGGAKFGLRFLLVIAALIQLVVIILTISGSKKLSFEKVGFFLQIGSALLHLGLVIFLFDFMLLANNPNHMTIFWVSTAFIGIGMALSFYSQELSKLLRRKRLDSAIIDPTVLTEES